MPNAFVDKFNHIIGHKGFDYDQITEEVFVGTNMCCQFGFDHELLSKNVRADISLEDLKVDAPLGVDYFLWLPTKDNFAPTQDKLKFGVQALEFLISRKIKIYIHCKNGHGRAPTLYVAYLIKQGMEVNEAMESLKSKRPVVHFSKYQIDGLNQFKNSLR